MEVWRTESSRGRPAGLCNAGSKDRGDVEELLQCLANWKRPKDTRTADLQRDVKTSLENLSAATFKLTGNIQMLSLRDSTRHDARLCCT